MYKNEIFVNKAETKPKQENFYMNIQSINLAERRGQRYQSVFQKIDICVFTFNIPVISLNNCHSLQKVTATK